MILLNKNGVSHHNNINVAEKTIQMKVEQNLKDLFRLDLVKTELRICDEARSGTVGIDKNNQITIIEYKQLKSSSIINQALFYRECILEKRDMVESIVWKECNVKVDWSRVNIICIAKKFTKYDKKVFRKMDPNLRLIKYNSYDMDTFIFDEVDPQPISINIQSAHIQKSPLEEFLKDVAKLGILHGNNKIYGKNFGKGCNVALYVPSSTGAGQYGRNKREARIHGKPLIVMNIDYMVRVLNKINKTKHYDTNKMMAYAQSDFERIGNDEKAVLVRAPHGYKVSYRIGSGKYAKPTSRLYTAFDKRKLCELVPQWGELCRMMENKM